MVAHVPVLLNLDPLAFGQTSVFIMKNRVHFTVLFLHVFFLTPDEIHAKYHSIELPLPYNTTDVVVSSDEKIQTKSKEFSLITDDICNDVVQFYDGIMSEQHYVEYFVDTIGTGEWNVNGIKRKNIFHNDLPAKYVKSWADKEKTLRFLLSISAFPKNEKTLCKVIISVSNFFSASQIIDFFDQLSDNERKYINSLIEKYSAKDGEMKIERALRENGDDKLLLEFVRLLGQVQKMGVEHAEANVE